MKQKYVIGIDISKSKLDCAVIDFNHQLHLEKQIKNNQKALQTFLQTLLKSLGVNQEEVLICFENTGIYNRPLELICVKLGVKLWVEHALKIKRATTDMRGKDDRKDAQRIAQYAVRYIDKILEYQEPSDLIKEMHLLTKSRNTLLSQKVAIDNQIKEAKTHDTFEYKILTKAYAKALKVLKKSIKEIEVKIESLIQQDAAAKQNIDLITSIPGIGNQVAINLIIATNNFESFNSAKHLACYAGVVPFKNESGVVIKKARISKMANKNIKSLMHLAAMAAVRFDSELKEYFIRKVKEGKNKMSVLNAVRNKLIHRIMAVIKRRQPYLRKDEYFYQQRNNFSCFLT